MKKYDPKSIELKWQKTWEDTGLYKTRQDRATQKYYPLVMFPYPSGDLHIGHWYSYCPPDSFARYHRMLGENVLYPMGFDAFGLPAENAAIKRHIPPAKWTELNIKNMTRQLKSMGPAYDWDKAVDTSRPEYYQWTQWLFLKLYEKGLAYRAKGWQNWCPKDQTVLANEQVIGPNNVCDRCGTPVIKKELEQWFFKITDYADRLISDLDKVEWPDKVKTMQENWIGRSTGARVKFPVVGSKEVIEVFTTRIDTLFSGTFVILAPEHPLVTKLTTPEQKSKVESYLKQAAGKTERDRLEEGLEKTGVFTGSYVINPANEAKMPVWVADFVLANYGTGAVFADGHDERDAELARKYDIPLKYSIEPVTGTKQDNPTDKNKIVALIENAKGEVLTINWGPKLGGRLLVGGTMEAGEDAVETAIREIAEETGYYDLELVERGDEQVHHEYFAHSKGKAFVAHTTPLHFKLTHDRRAAQKLEDNEKDKFKVEWVSREVAAAEVVDPLHRFVFDKFIEHKVWTGDGILYNSGQFDGLTSAEARTKITEWLAQKGSAEFTTQYRLRDWLISRQRYWGAPIPIVYCDQCGTVPVPEDQLPVELPLDVEFEPTGKSPLELRPDFYQTKCPHCGGPAKRETDTMDTFVDSSWYFLRYPNNHYAEGPFDPEAVKYWAPVDQYMGGVEHAILHLLYARFITKALYDQKLIEFDEPFKKLFNQGLIMGPDGQKMSKSRGNVVNPDDWVGKFGADTFRLYLMFMGPYDQGGPFDTSGIAGVYRFLNRLWNFVQEFVESKDQASAASPLAAQLETQVHKTIKIVGQSIETFKFNLAVSNLMETLNAFQAIGRDFGFGHRDEWGSALKTYILLIAPLAPHIAEELWHALNQTESVHAESWPKYNPELLKAELIEIIIQVNGKLRATLTLPPDASEDDIKQAAHDNEIVKRNLEGKKVIKTIIVPRKLVNFVVQ